MGDYSYNNKYYLGANRMVDYAAKFGDKSKEKFLLVNERTCTYLDPKENVNEELKILFGQKRALPFHTDLTTASCQFLQLAYIDQEGGSYGQLLKNSEMTGDFQFTEFLYKREWNKLPEELKDNNVFIQTYGPRGTKKNDGTLSKEEINIPSVYQEKETAITQNVMIKQFAILDKGIKYYDGKIDKNKNGDVTQVTKQNLDQAAYNLAYIDTLLLEKESSKKDQDAMQSQKETKTIYREPGDPVNRALNLNAVEIEKSFATWDLDNDGYVSPEEKAKSYRYIDAVIEKGTERNDGDISQEGCLKLNDLFNSDMEKTKAAINSYKLDVTNYNPFGND